MATPSNARGDQEPAVSIVIASYNARGTIAACLGSLTAQVDAPPCEIIVVDSSNDGTAEVVRRDFPAVRLIELPRRVHPGNARNRGVAAARGAILAFTDADCTVDSGWVRAIVTAHEREA